MVCPDCQVLVVNNIKTYDRVQHSQKGLAKYSSMLLSNVKNAEKDDFDLNESDEKTNQAEVNPTSKFQIARKRPKRNAKPTNVFKIYEDIEFFHFEKKKMVPAKIMSKLKNGKYSVLVAKSVPPQMLDISPIFINKINCT